MAGYKTKLGKCEAEDSINGLGKLENGSLNLIFTSPPFALQRKKEYGNCSQDEYVEWLLEFGRVAFDKIADDGSFVIDIGGAYEKGTPSYSLYQFKFLIAMVERVGYHLAQPFYWYNPGALPAPIEWVNKRKLRAKSAVNTLWWFCKNPFCKADVRQVLVPYSSRMQKLIKKPESFVAHEGLERPSGHVLGMKSWCHDNGGALPSNLLQISNTESNSSYLRYCKELQIRSHPARFPAALPEFFIKMLTNPGDLVVDIFSGSNTTGMVCEKLGRKWLAFDIDRDYVAASVMRFMPHELNALNQVKADKIHKIIKNGGFVDLGDVDFDKNYNKADSGSLTNPSLAS